MTHNSKRMINFPRIVLFVFQFYITSIGFPNSFKRAPVLEECRWACFFQDSTKSNVMQFCKDWINKDSTRLLELRKIISSNETPRSEFYLYIGTLEYLSGIWFGSLADPYEYAPSNDNLSNSDYEILRRKIIVEYYNHTLLDILYFKHYPVQYEQRMMPLFMYSIDNGFFDSVTYFKIRDSIVYEVRDGKCQNEFSTFDLPNSKLLQGKAYEKIDSAIRFDNVLHIKTLQDSLNNPDLSIVSYFTKCYQIFNAMGLDMQKLKHIQLSDYDFINEQEYGELRRNWLFFINSYIESKIGVIKVKDEKLYEILNDDKQIGKYNKKRMIKYLKT